MAAFAARWVERLWSEAEADYRRQLLAALPRGSGLRLLDVGCDDGAWTEELRRQMGIDPGRVHGLELVVAQAELARARGFDVRTGDVEDTWPFAEASVDVVHANQVIEHVKRLDHFVEETKRVLVPGGLAIVCTENLASWHNVAALTLGYQPFSAANLSLRGTIGNPFSLHRNDARQDESWQHVHVVTLTALTDLFAAHGFRIERRWGAGYHPFAGAVASRLARFDPRHAHFIGLVARA